MRLADVSIRIRTPYQETLNVGKLTTSKTERLIIPVFDDYATLFGVNYQAASAKLRDLF